MDGVLIYLLGALISFLVVINLFRWLDQTEPGGTICSDPTREYTTGCGTYPPDISDKNQCDGCKRGLPIIDGIHREQNGKPYMCCSRNRYS